MIPTRILSRRRSQGGHSSDEHSHLRSKANCTVYSSIWRPEHSLWHSGRHYTTQALTHHGLASRALLRRPEPRHACEEGLRWHSGLVCRRELFLPWCCSSCWNLFSKATLFEKRPVISCHARVMQARLFYQGTHLHAPPR